MYFWQNVIMDYGITAGKNKMRPQTLTIFINLWFDLKNENKTVNAYYYLQSNKNT